MPDKKKVITDSYEMADFLSSYAKKLSESTLLRDKIASTMIYAGIAEFYADKFLDFLCKNASVGNTKIKINKDYIKNGKNTNLEKTLQGLEHYDYPRKKELEDTITIIKDARNDFFHNLVTAGEKKINLQSKMVIVQSYTPLIRKMIVEIMVKTL